MLQTTIALFSCNYTHLKHLLLKTFNCMISFMISDYQLGYFFVYFIHTISLYGTAFVISHLAGVLTHLKATLSTQ